MLVNIIFSLILLFDIFVKLLFFISYYNDKLL